MKMTYKISGQAQNRINQLMVKHSPNYSLVIWLASLSCLIVPMLVFGRSLSTITLSGLFGSSLVTFCILKFALKYAINKRYSLHYQPNLELETRTLTLNESDFCISSDLLRPTSRDYRQIKSIVVEDNIVIIRGKGADSPKSAHSQKGAYSQKRDWFELIPRDCITEGNGGFIIEELSERAGVRLN